MIVCRRIPRSREQVEQGEAGLFRAAARGGLFPHLRLRDRPANPERQQRRHDADQVHVAPRVWPERTDKQPDQRRHEEADAETALHQPGALAARAIGPQLRDHRRPRRPLGSDRDADEKPQQRKGDPVEGERAEAGRQRIGEHGDDHHPLAPDVVGENAADHPADAPSEQRDGDDGAGVSRNLRMQLWRQQLLHRHADGQDQAVGFKPIEQPAQVRGDKRVPLHPVQRAVPGD